MSVPPEPEEETLEIPPEGWHIVTCFMEVEENLLPNLRPLLSDVRVGSIVLIYRMYFDGEFSG